MGLVARKKKDLIAKSTTQAPIWDHNAQFAVLPCPPLVRKAWPCHQKSHIPRWKCCRLDPWPRDCRYLGAGISKETFLLRCLEKWRLVVDPIELSHLEIAGWSSMENQTTKIHLHLNFIIFQPLFHCFLSSKFEVRKGTNLHRDLWKFSETKMHLIMKSARSSQWPSCVIYFPS